MKFKKLVKVDCDTVQFNFSMKMMGNHMMSGRHCDVGQNILYTIIYLDWLTVWNMLLVVNDGFPLSCVRLVSQDATCQN